MQGGSGSLHFPDLPRSTVWFDTTPCLSSEAPGSMPLTRKYFSKRTLEVLKVPMVSMSITVLKALKDRALAGHRKFPAAPEPQGQAGQS